MPILHTVLVSEILFIIILHVGECKVISVLDQGKCI